MSATKQTKTIERDFDLRALNTQGNSAKLIELVMLCDTLSSLASIKNPCQGGSPQNPLQECHDALLSSLTAIKQTMYERIDTEVATYDDIEDAFGESKRFAQRVYEALKTEGASVVAELTPDAYVIKASSMLFDVGNVIVHKELSNFCSCTIKKNDDVWVASAIINNEDGYPEIIYISTNGVYTPIETGSSILNIVYVQALWSIVKALSSGNLSSSESAIDFDEHMDTLATPLSKLLLKPLAYATLGTVKSLNPSSYEKIVPSELHSMKNEFIRLANEAVLQRDSEQVLETISLIASTASKRLLKDIEGRPYLYDDSQYSLWMGFHREICKEIFNTSIRLDDTGQSLLFTATFDSDEWAVVLKEGQEGVLDAKELYQNGVLMHPHRDMLFVDALNIWCTGCLAEVLVREPQ